MRPYAVVKDRGFLSLMKTGHPGYWVPSLSTVIRDTRFVYNRTREKLAHVLQEYEGDVSLSTDAWSSLNHRAFMAITVHFVYKEEPISLLLDVVEVPEVCVPDYGWDEVLTMAFRTVAHQGKPRRCLHLCVRVLQNRGQGQFCSLCGCISTYR